MNKLPSVLLRITIDPIRILGMWEESSFLMLGFACKELGFGLSFVLPDMFYNVFKQHMYIHAYVCV